MPSPVVPHHREDDVVDRLQKSEIFRDYQDAFQTATGLPLVLRPVGSFHAPMAGARNANPFCQLMAARSAACAGCLRLQQKAEDAAGTAPLTVECFAGLSDSLVPVRIGHRVVAFLQTGQVLLAAPREVRFRAAMKQILEWDPSANTAEFHAAYFKSRVLTKTHYAAAVRLLASFASHLSLVSNELVIRETSAEPPAVVRARAFIAEHLGEALCLEQVARAAHMSPFYFCKVFKSATGFTLTDYIARARVEKVKQMLLNPHTRVSEAAYEAGFQSLSQFNRVFRRIAGQAPSDYRQHLHGAGDVSAPAAGQALPFAA
jgi:AraC-like DNA-binding protein/ligand-binding sensor protein